MVIKVLQTNLNHCCSAQDLLLQAMGERGAGLAIAAEPYRIPDRPAWVGDRCGSVAIIRGGGDCPPVSLLEAGDGFVAVEWGSIAVVIGCYFSPNRPLVEFEGFLDSVGGCISRHFQRPVIVAGDFNAKSTVWGSPATTPRGSLLEEWASALDLGFMNRGSTATCVRPNGESIVDLTMASRRAARLIRDWRVSVESETLSDHRYILWNVACDSHQRVARRRGDGSSPRWSFRSLDRDVMMAAALAMTWPDDPDRFADAEEGADWLRGAMSQVCDVAMNRVGSAPQRKAVYWWSQEIAELRSACTIARRRYTRSKRRRREDPLRVAAFYDAYRDARAALQRAIKLAKARAWRDLLASVDSDPWGRPYKMVLNRLRPWAPPVTESLDPRFLVEVVDTLFPREGGEPGHRPIEPTEPGGDWSAELGVSWDEIAGVAAKFRVGKAPGPDGIPGRLWALTLGCFGNRIRSVYDLCFRQGSFPDMWKGAKLVLLRKEGKPSTSPSAYRPICLLDEVGKMFERIIANRLVRHLETGGSGLAECQFGFRAGRSTIDAIDRVRAHSEFWTARGFVALAVSLDISNAFNSISWGKILEGLEYHGVPSYLRRVVGAYLSSRWVGFADRDGRLHRRELDRGVPQGSVLGPLLWNIGFDAVLRTRLPSGVSVSCYADDTLVIVGEESWQRAARLMELTLARIGSVIGSLGLAIAPQKTEAIGFSGLGGGGDLPPPGLTLRCGGATVAIGSRMKYLGLVLDSRWHFGDHFDGLVPRVTRTAGALSQLMPNLGGPRDSVRRLYVGVVRSIVLYGAPVWKNDLIANLGVLRRLDDTHRRLAIRVARCYRTVSRAAASAVAGVPPLHLSAEELASVFRGRQGLRAGCSGGGPVDERSVGVLRVRARRVLFERWREWLSQPPNAQKRVVHAILPHLRRWVERGFGGLSFRLSQVLTGHGCFGEYLARIGREATPGCHHCGGVLDSAQHTLEVCPAWGREREILKGTIGRDLSLAAVVRAMLRGEREWKAVSSFCEQVMQQKEEAERDRERADPARVRRRGGRRGRT